MKYIGFFASLLLFTSAFGQTRHIKKILINGKSPELGSSIVFVITNFQQPLDRFGNVDFTFYHPEKRIFYCTDGTYRSRFFYADSSFSADTVLNFQIPDVSYYEDLHKNGACPICLKKDSVIKIMYGKPSKKPIAEAAKGEIRLGGCGVGLESPKLYCKRDDFGF